MDKGTWSALAEVAARQLGLVVRDDLRALGISGNQVRRWCDAGVLQRLGPGVLGVAGTPPSWRRSLLSAQLATRGTVSHRAAAALWGFDTFRGAVLQLSVASWSNSTATATTPPADSVSTTPSERRRSGWRGGWCCASPTTTSWDALSTSPPRCGRRCTGRRPRERARPDRTAPYEGALTPPGRGRA